MQFLSVSLLLYLFKKIVIHISSRAQLLPEDLLLYHGLAGCILVF